MEPWPGAAWRLALRIYALLLITAIVAYLLFVLRALVALILIASILAIGITPIVHRMHSVTLPLVRRRLPVALCVLLIYLALLLGVGLFVTLSVPPLVAEIREFIDVFPAYVMALRESLTILESQYPWLVTLEAEALRGLQQLPQELQSELPRVLGLAAGVVGLVLSTTVVLALTLYLVLEGEGLRDFLLLLVPTEHRHSARHITDEIGRRTVAWLAGQFFLAVVIYVFTALGLLVIGVPYPFLIALVAGIGEIIPLVGPVIGGLVAGTVAAFQSPWHLVATVVFYVFLQQVESNWLAPKVLSNAVGISPLTVLLALIAGATLMGVLGAILAVPVAAALQVLVSEVLRPTSQQHAKRPATEA